VSGTPLPGRGRWMCEVQAEAVLVLTTGVGIGRWGQRATSFERDTFPGLPQDLFHTRSVRGAGPVPRRTSM